MPWQDLEQFIQETSYTKAQIAKLVKEGEIEAKNEEGKLLLRHAQSLPTLKQNAPAKESAVLMQDVVQKILDIHSKFALAKDELLAGYKSENEFLKNVILSMQEAYMQDKQMLDFLRKEVETSREELETMRKKYKVMWERAKDHS